MEWNEFPGYHGVIPLEGDTFQVTGYTLNFQSRFIFDVNGNKLEPGDKVIIYSASDAGERWVYMGHFGNAIVIHFDEPNYNQYLMLSQVVIPSGTIFSLELDSFALCFLSGTTIACPDGDRSVEDLAIGDVVSTADGGTRRVKWIGRQTVMPRFADPLQSFPIRIRANALSDGVPSRDLCVSPDHAVLVDGSLVQAGALVDGVAVERMTNLPERFVYYHIEVEDHALILAENTPAETFVDNVTRRRFDNWREYEELYGEEALNIPELEMPRVRSSRQLPRPIATRLAARAKRLFGGRRRGTAA